MEDPPRSVNGVEPESRCGGMQELQKAEDEAQAQHDSAAKKAAELSNNHAALEKAAGEAKMEEDAASKVHKDKKEKLKKSNEEKEEAQTKLKTFRGGAPKKSAGLRVQTSLLVCAAVSFAALIAPAC